jgi:hypothetical protein
VAKYFGAWTGVAAGIAAVIGFLAIMHFLGRISYRRHQRKMREKYRRIFRVLDLPADEKSVIKPKGAEVRVGDYGWESGPIRKNDLIYLTGFDDRWRMIWWAGFRPDQIEHVGPKPLSQYDKPKTPCPFPVQPRQII